MRIIVISIYDGGYCASICYHNTSSGDKDFYDLCDFDRKTKSYPAPMPPVIRDLAYLARMGHIDGIKEILSFRGRTLFDLAIICVDGGIELLKGAQK